MQNNDPIFQQLDPDYPASALVDCLGGDPNFVWAHIHMQTKQTQRYELMDIFNFLSPKLGLKQVKNDMLFYWLSPFTKKSQIMTLMRVRDIRQHLQALFCLQ